MDELEKLRKQLDEERRLRVEEQRLRVEEQRLRVEEQQRRFEEQRRREEAEEALRDRDAVIIALQQDKQDSLRVQLDQPLDDYLVSIHRLNFHLNRLVPPARTAVPPTLSEGEESNPTTSGRTTIVGKFYPLKMRVWSDFDQVYRASFDRLRAAVGDQRLFPSISSVEEISKRLAEALPLEFLGTTSFLNELKSSFFLSETLEMPAQRILNAYLQTGEYARKKLYFDNRTAGWRARAGNVSVLTEGDEDTRAEGVEATGAAGGAAVAGNEASAKPPLKTHPDCIVLCANILISPADLQMATDVTDAAGESNIRNVHRVTLAEHKAVHRLRAAAASQYLRKPFDEDIMLQLAQVARRGATPAAQENTVREAKRGAPGQIFFVRALTQAFHYMVSSGLEFGYMASGETLSFLRVSRDDPTTLFYHTALFPQYCRRRLDGDGTVEITDDLPDNDNARLAVSMLSAICLLAFESTPELPRRRSINISQLARFPELPETASSVSSRQGSQQPPSRGSSPGNRKRPNDDDGHGDSGSDDSRGPRFYAPAHRPRRSSPLKRQRSASTHTEGDDGTEADEAQDSGMHGRKKRRVGLQYGSDTSHLRPTLPSPLDPSTFRPIRPYCTQACLRSLVRDEEPDYDCPNIVLHMQALRRDCTDLRQHPRVHAITRNELCELVQLQLITNAEQDCECLIDQGLLGAIGCLFKITITGYGYTFVAKGVQSFHSHRLRREIVVYDTLAAQQGVSIPVCLGMIQLLLPYPMVDCTLVTHMLLMSYAGLPLYSSKLHRLPEMQGVDLDRESQRTLEELHAVGLVDEDDESNGNLTWCKEVARVMKIDFDHAYVRRRVAAAKNKNRDSQGGENNQDSRDGVRVVPAQHWDDSGEWERARNRLPITKQARVAVEGLLLA